MGRCVGKESIVNRTAATSTPSPQSQGSPNSPTIWEYSLSKDTSNADADRVPLHSTHHQPSSASNRYTTILKTKNRCKKTLVEKGHHQRWKIYGPNRLVDNNNGKVCGEEIFKLKAYNFYTNYINRKCFINIKILPYIIYI